MKINLLSCEAQRPDKRKIGKCIAEISSGIDERMANQLTDMLIEGDTIEIEIADKNTGSALGVLRKLKIDYDIIE